MLAFVERAESAIRELKKGNMLILTDHPEREDEGDLILPAEKVTAENMNFIIRHSSGIVCLSLLEQQLNQLDLPLMVPENNNTSLRGTPFTISIDAKAGITTGVSAEDRVRTVLTAIDELAKPADLARPGHIFPLRAQAGGVLTRAGHTEGSIDITTLAGFKPAAVLCELMNPDGSMMRGKKLLEFALQHQIKILSIEDIVAYRLAHENFITEEVTAQLPIKNGSGFQITVVKDKLTGLEHTMLSKEHSSLSPYTLVRIHSACLTGDLFESLRCDCHQQLTYSLERINEAGGLLIYLNQEGRGIGLLNKIKAYALQEQGFDTIEANQQLGLPVDSREYYIAANMLRNRNIQRVKLLTNNPEKVQQLQKLGIQEVVMENTPTFYTEHNKQYLQVKKVKLNHQIGI